MTSILDFSLEQTRNYLQNVLFIDDKIYGAESQRPSASEVSDDDLGDVGKSLDQMREPSATPDEAENEPELEAEAEGAKDDEIADPPFNARDIVDSFAVQGILCGLFQPEGSAALDATDNTDLVRLCERADVVIIDWDLDHDGGERVKNFLSSLVKSSQQSEPHHSRLCVIYTNKPGLFDVMQQLDKTLGQDILDHDFDEDALQITAGATRISIIGKPDVPGRAEAEKEKFEVAESNLAERVIDEFSRLHGGLLPGLTLAALAAIRRNSMRFLDKFGSELDAPLLLHRALTLPQDDTIEQFGELLSGEVLSVLEEGLPPVDTFAEIASLRANQFDFPDVEQCEWTNSGNDEENTIDMVAVLRAFLKEGQSVLKTKLKDCRDLWPSNRERKMGIRGAAPERLNEIAKLVTGSLERCEELASLFSLRTHYGTTHRKLRFGTILRHRKKSGDAWSYSVCLMPICDCQRLREGEAVTFPLWRLRVDALKGLTEKRAGISVGLPEGTNVSLATGGKLRKMLWLQEFTATSSGWAEANRDHDGIFRFEVNQLEIEWIAELRTLHVQRIAEDFGNKASRVGLVESEWLRLLCDR